MSKLEWFIQTSTISDVPQETATTTTAIMTTTIDELAGKILHKLLNRL